MGEDGQRDTMDTQRKTQENVHFLVSILPCDRGKMVSIYRPII